MQFYRRQPCYKQTSSQVLFKNFVNFKEHLWKTAFENNSMILFFDLERSSFNTTYSWKWKYRAWTISILGSLKVLLTQLLISEKILTYSTLVSSHINFSFFNFVQTPKHITSVYKQHYWVILCVKTRSYIHQIVCILTLHRFHTFF